MSQKEGTDEERKDGYAVTFSVRSNNHQAKHKQKEIMRDYEGKQMPGWMK